jgi:hypothetical protein
MFAALGLGNDKDKDEAAVKFLEHKITTACGAAVKKEFESFQTVLIQKLDTIVSRVAQVEKRQDDLEEKVTTIESNTQQELLSIRDEIHEQKRQILKMCNIVMMGVPETADGLTTAAGIMNVIAPTWGGTIQDNRIGDPTGRKPRPLRIIFSNVAEKNAALNNCKKLANMQAYGGVSVRRDLTKRQQEEWKGKSAARARPPTRGSTNGGGKGLKRPSNTSPSSSNSKISRMETQ